MSNREQLAMYGGTPVRETNLPYARQSIDKDDIAAVEKVLTSDFLTTGPTVPHFEKKIANFVGAKFAVAFSSGTAALHGACYAAGITKGDEVITTPFTFSATSNSVLYVGGTPIFADINPQTYNISPEAIEELITPKTKAIIAVDYAGQPAEYEKILKLAKKHGLVVIGDAAHAIGATYNGNNVGTIADMTMFSFHPVKQITTGEGGMITTNDQSYYEKLMLFRSHGITRDVEKLNVKHEVGYYEMQDLGFNYRMTDIQAALGISQLNKLPLFLSKRKQLAENYDKVFKHYAEIQIPLQLENCQSSWHLYVVRFHVKKMKMSRKEIFKALQAENIGVNIHYIPVYLHPYYKQLGYEKGLCPNAEKVYEEIITLPLFPNMTDRDQQNVIEAVEKVIFYSRKHGVTK